MMAGSFIIPVVSSAEIRRAYFPAAGLMVLIARGLAFSPIAGNSGNTDAPHRHIHVQLPGTANEPMLTDSLVISRGGPVLVCNDLVVMP